MLAEAKLQAVRINVKLITLLLTTFLRAKFVFPVAFGQVNSLLLVHMVLFLLSCDVALLARALIKKTAVPATGTTVFCRLELLTELNVTRCIHYVPNRENTLKCTTNRRQVF